HFELYVAGSAIHSHDGESATGPSVEFNYGAFPNTQLHVIAPFVYDHPLGEDVHYGYGDTELGVKYRFIQETDKVPQIGVFPLLELPTGNHRQGLGNGKAQVFLPVWAQKSWGEENRQ